MDYNIPNLPLSCNLETKEILLQLIRSNKALAELKGVANLIPNEQILISTLTLQEARDSSMVEDIVTTQDDLYKAGLNAKDSILSPATKEVLNYRTALNAGYRYVTQKGLITSSTILSIHEQIVGNGAGYRNKPGTVIGRRDGVVVYTPPQDSMDVLRYMDNLERYMNDDELCPYDPLIKMAVIHHQFESIHPFSDGNGRTGRIINVLYLVRAGLLEMPILYLSRYITHNKSEYYRLLQAVREKSGDNSEQWEAWVLFMLKGVEETAIETIRLVRGISKLMSHFKNIMRPDFGRSYKHEMLNNLFAHPYTKISHLAEDMQVGRLTARKYLERIVELGLLKKEKWGKSNYYINEQLVKLFCGDSDAGDLVGNK